MSIINNETLVNAFYLAYYGRPADPSGLAFWSQQLARANGDLAAIAPAFTTSEEATVRFGASDVTTRITDIYEQLFDRAPDSEGLAFWTKAIAQGHASMADIAILILQSAEQAGGEDGQLAALRQQAAESFTAEVVKSGVDYDGYAAIEASRVLVKAVTLQSSAADIQAMVKATAKLADIAHDNPKVLEAIATGTTLVALFDTARGEAEPVDLVQALADVAQAAAGSPSTLDSLLRGGGMGKVLEVMPSAATLHDVVDALATGGLPAAVEVVYPTAPAPEPEPQPQPQPEPQPEPQPQPGPVAGTLVFIGLEGGSGSELPVTNNAMLMVELQGQPEGSTFSVQISRNGSDWGTASDIGPQTDGAYYYRAVVTDEAGRTSYSNVIGAVLDRAAPMLVMVDPGQTDGLLALGETMTMKIGFSEAVYVNPDALPVLALQNGGTATYQGGSGTTTLVFSYTPAAGDDSGVFGTAALDALVGRLTDRAGNAVRAGALDGIVLDDIAIDAEAPQQALTVTTIARKDGVSAPSTSAEVPLTTSLAEAALHAALSAPLADGEYVEYSLDNGANWNPTYDVDGLAVTVADIATAGNPTVILRVSDAAGNHGAEVRQAIAYDGEAPQLGTVALVSLTQGAGDTAPDDAVTSVALVDAQFSFSGSLAAGDILEYSLDGQGWIPVAVDSGGQSVTIRGIDLAAGAANADGDFARTVSLRAVDSTGNAGAPASRVIVYDKQAPAGGTLSFLEISEDELDVTPDNVTSIAVARIAFQHAGAPLADDERWEYSLDGTTWKDAGVEWIPSTDVVRFWTDISQGALDANGNRATTVSVRAVDAAGNSRVVGSADVVYDDHVGTPTLALDQDTAAPGGAEGDRVTRVGSYSVNGIEAGSRVEYSLSGTGGWTDTAPVAVEGPNTVHVRQIDAAGNVSDNGTLVFTLDTTVAELAFGQVQGWMGAPNRIDREQADVVFTYAGALQAGDKVEYRIDGGAWMADDTIVIDDIAGTITLKGVRLADADPLVELRVSDVAGNASTASVTVDGPFTLVPPSLVTEVTPEGLKATSSVNGSLYLMFDTAAGYGAYHTGGSYAVSAGVQVFLGAQPWPGTGPLAVGLGGGQFVYDSSERVYLFGSNGDDELEYHGANDVTAWGFGGGDTIVTGAGNDVVFAGDGGNTITTGKGADRIDVSRGENTLNFNAGDSSVANGIDVVDFGAGNMAMQKFVFSGPIYEVDGFHGFASPTDGSNAALLAALNNAFGGPLPNVVAAVIDFVNQDRYVVVDLDVNGIDANDLIIKLVGTVSPPMYMNDQLVFGSPP